MHIHNHDQNHLHEHQHTTAPGEIRGIAWAFALNLVFTIIEFVCGYWFHSAAILGEAVHDLGDSLAIALAWWFQVVSTRKATSRFTYGFTRFSLLAALLNSLILIVGSLAVLWLALPRLLNPVMPDATGMVGLAVLGVAINGYAAYKVTRGSSLNSRVVSWHLFEDVLGWVAILVVGATLHVVDWPVLDPLLSIVFAVFIMFNVVRVLRQTLTIFFQAVPDEEVLSEVKGRIESLDDVERLHQAHFWSLDGTSHVFTAHVELKTVLSHSEQSALKCRIAGMLEPFEFSHTTIEFEFPGEACRDTPQNHSVSRRV